MSRRSECDKCPQCGGNARRCGRPGRTIPYRTVPALEIPATALIPRCRKCSHEWLDARAQADLKPVLTETYRSDLRRRFRSELPKVLLCITQRRLEQILGLSQGYLSRLLAGAGTPSSELVSNIGLIALDPEERLRQLERFWSIVPAPMPAPSRRRAAGPLPKQPVVP